MDSKLGAKDGNRLGVAVASCEGSNVGSELLDNGDGAGDCDGATIAKGTKLGAEDGNTMLGIAVAS